MKSKSREAKVLRAKDRRADEAGRITGKPLFVRGFVQVPRLVLEDPRLSDADLRVYHWLAWYAHGGGNCWPGQECLAKLLGRDVRSVRRSLQSLEVCGYVRPRRRGRGHTNDYEMVYDLPHGHPSLEHDRTDLSGHVGHDRTDLSGLERTGVSGHESHERTNLSGPSDMYIEPKKIEGEVEAPAPLFGAVWRAADSRLRLRAMTPLADLWDAVSQEIDAEIALAPGEADMAISVQADLMQAWQPGWGPADVKAFVRRQVKAMRAKLLNDFCKGLRARGVRTAVHRTSGRRFGVDVPMEGNVVFLEGESGVMPVSRLDLLGEYEWGT